MALVAGFDLRPGELLYSALARFSDCMRFPRMGAVLEAAFGCTTGIATIDLPGRLVELARRWRPTCEGQAGSIAYEIAVSHTLFPYYAAFIPQERAARAAWVICNAGAQTLHGIFGIRSSTVALPRRLRHCPDCLGEDRGHFGSAHWHREHQVPGTLVCHQHDQQLVESGVERCRIRSRLRFVSLDQTLSSASALADVRLPDQAHLRSALRRLSLDSAELVNDLGATAHGGVMAHGCNLDALRAVHHFHLRRCGFVHRSRVSARAVRTALTERYGIEFLAGLGCALREGCDDWVARLLRRPRGARHPLQHLLLLQLYETPVYAFIAQLRDEEMCRASSARRTQSAPCLNPLCQTFRPAGPAPDVAVSHRCMMCGYAYKRSAGSRARIVTLAHGGMWEAELVRLVGCMAVSLREIARRLGVDPRTVQRHARRLGVWRTEWGTWERSAPATRRSDAAEQTLARHRQEWQQLIAARPEARIHELRRVAPTTYSYLYRYDPTFLQEACSSRRSHGRKPPAARVDWAVRDAALLGEAHSTVALLRKAPGRPLRLCFSTVARAMGHAAVLEQHGDRLPRTTRWLVANTESPDAYALRKIEWVCSRALPHEPLSRSALIQRAGLSKSVATRLADQITFALRRFS